MSTFKDDFIEANGIRQHYWRTGDGSKPALVVCHGVTDNGLCWTPVARALENDFDVIMLDARGHGLSDAPESGYATADLAADLAACIRALGLEKPAVLGHSMGGATVSYAAYQHPELIGKALLEDPGWWDDDSPRQTMPEEDRQTFAAEWQNRIIEQKQRSLKSLIGQCRKDCPTWPEEELEPWALSKQQLSLHILQIFAQHRPPWRKIAAGMHCPTLLITAEVTKGCIVTPQMAEEAPHINPHIQVAHIPGAGHNIRREAFQTYMEAVKAFLQEG